MSLSQAIITKALLDNALQWFQPDFQQRLVGPIESQYDEKFHILQAPIKVVRGHRNFTSPS